MTKQYEIQEYIKGNVYKGKDELGNIVWHTFDAREGDTFHSETYAEAVSIFVRNWDNLTFQEKELAFYNSDYFHNNKEKFNFYNN